MPSPGRSIQLSDPRQHTLKAVYCNGGTSPLLPCPSHIGRGSRGQGQEYTVLGRPGTGWKRGRRQGRGSIRQNFLTGLFSSIFLQRPQISQPSETHKLGPTDRDANYTGPGMSGKARTLTLNLAAALPSALGAALIFTLTQLWGPSAYA